MCADLDEVVPISKCPFGSCISSRYCRMALQLRFYGTRVDLLICKLKYLEMSGPRQAGVDSECPRDEPGQGLPLRGL
jgi:hypothetical protein